MLVPGLVQPVKTHARISRIQLQVEGRRLDGLLFLASQFNKAVCEGIGDSEFYYPVRRIFSISL